MFFAILSRQSAGSRSTLRWDFEGELQDAGGDEAADGADVAAWITPSGAQLAQSSGGARPAADDDGFPGRRAALFAGSDHLLATVPFDVGTVLVVFGLVSGARTVAAQDTSDTTTKPFFAARIEQIGGGVHLVDLSGNVLIASAGNYLATPGTSYRMQTAGGDLLIASAGNYLSAQ